MSIKKPSITIKRVLETSLLFLLFSIFSIQSHADLSVGDSYGGGTVFCVSQTPDIKKCVTQGSGKYGLIMANKDSNGWNGNAWSIEWKETKALSNYDGAANTAAIMVANPLHFSGAAWLCHDYNRAHGQDTSKSLTAWYLPAKNELNKMFLYAKANNLIGENCIGSKPRGVQCLTGGDDNPEVFYWSSTEYSGGVESSAWFQMFSSGDQNHAYKSYYKGGVRAVRAFYAHESMDVSP